MSFTTTILIGLGITAFIWTIFYIYDVNISKRGSKSKIYESPFKRPIKEDNRVHISPENHLKSVSEIIGKTQVSVPILSTELNDILSIDNQELNDESISFLGGNTEEEIEQNINNTLHSDSYDDAFLPLNDDITIEENLSLEMEENEVDIALKTMESHLNYDEGEYYEFLTVPTPVSDSFHT